MFYDGQKMYHQMQGVGGWGNEFLSSLVEPVMEGDQKEPSSEMKKWGRKNPTTEHQELSTRTWTTGKWKLGEPYYDFEGKAGEAPVQRQAP